MTTLDSLIEREREALEALSGLDEYVLKIAKDVIPLLRQYGSNGLLKETVDELWNITVLHELSGSELATLIGVREASTFGEVLSTKCVRVEVVDRPDLERSAVFVRSRFGLSLYIIETGKLIEVMGSDALSRFETTPMEVAIHTSHVVLGNERGDVSLYNGECVLSECTDFAEFVSAGGEEE